MCCLPESNNKDLNTTMAIRKSEQWKVATCSVEINKTVTASKKAIVRMKKSPVVLEGMHDEGFVKAIVPNLYKISDYVYRLRRNDHERLSLLIMDSKAREAEISRHLPFLKHLCGR